MKILKRWSDCCRHYIFFLENEKGVFVYYTHSKGGGSTPPGKDTITGWVRCDFHRLIDGYGGCGNEKDYGEPSSELEFVLLTGHSIEATMERDINGKE